MLRIIFEKFAKSHSITPWAKFYPILDKPNPLEWTIMAILHTTYLLFTLPSLKFLLTTYMPLLVYVVIECSLFQTEVNLYLAGFSHLEPLCGVAHMALSTATASRR